MGHSELELAVRIIAAMLAGVLIGMERHARAKDAGITTHTLLAGAAALLMIISQYAFPQADKFDASRVAAQVVSGVGFLGAGVIFVRHERLQGLTTAAGIFATAAIGMTYGAGMFVLATISTALLIGAHLFFDLPMFDDTRLNIRLRVLMDATGRPESAIDCIHAHEWHNVQPQIKAEPDGWRIETESFTRKKKDPYKLIEDLRNTPHVIEAELLQD